jgi:putative NADH-flavin reductase
LGARHIVDHAATLSVVGKDGNEAKWFAGAKDAGHEVVALRRNPDSLPIEHVRLARIHGNFTQPEQVRAVVAGADAVISVLGARKGGSATICADAISTVLAAMESTGTRRLIALSAYGAGQTRQASWFICFVRAVIGEKMRDKDNMESLVRASDTD